MLSTCAVHSAAQLLGSSVVGRPRLRYPVANILTSASLSPTSQIPSYPLKPCDNCATVTLPPVMAPRLCRLCRCFAFARRPRLCLLEPFFFFFCLIFIHRLHEASPLLSSSLARRDSFGAIVAAGDLCGKMGQHTLKGVVFVNSVMVQSAFKTMMCVLVALSLVTASIQVCGSHPSAVCCASQAFRSSQNPQCRWIHIQAVCTLNFALCDHSTAGFRTAVLGGSGGLQPRSGLRTELF